MTRALVAPALALTGLPLVASSRRHAPGASLDHCGKPGPRETPMKSVNARTSGRTSAEQTAPNVEPVGAPTDAAGAIVTWNEHDGRRGQTGPEGASVVADPFIDAARARAEHGWSRSWSDRLGRQGVAGGGDALELARNAVVVNAVQAAQARALRQDRQRSRSRARADDDFGQSGELLRLVDVDHGVPPLGRRERVAEAETDSAEHGRRNGSGAVLKRNDRQHGLAEIRSSLHQLGRVLGGSSSAGTETIVRPAQTTPVAAAIPLSAIELGPMIGPLLGGVGVALSIFFVVLLLALGALTIRRMLGG